MSRCSHPRGVTLENDDCVCCALDAERARGRREGALKMVGFLRRRARETRAAAPAAKVRRAAAMIAATAIESAADWLELEEGL